MRENKVFLQINNTNDNKKLIDYLLEFKVSKSYINNLFNLKKISLNEQILKNGEIVLKTNDIIEIDLPIDSVEPYKRILKFFMRIVLLLLLISLLIY